MTEQIEMFRGVPLRPPKKRGRKPVEIPPRKQGVAEAMLSAGATVTEIAAFLGVSRPTVRRLLSHHPAWSAKPGPRPNRPTEDRSR